jgi:predicted transcriptional regulator
MVVVDSIWNALSFFILRNKDGLTKKEAKKVYYSLRGGSSDDEEGNDPEMQARQTMDQVLNYMEETSKKLNKMEEDLTYLKRQVDQILRRL